MIYTLWVDNVPIFTAECKQVVDRTVKRLKTKGFDPVVTKEVRP